MKKLPIGIDDFGEMIEKNYYYVDKTFLIKEVVDLPGKVKLITRPRRFGKTLNMSMIKKFFSLWERKDLFEGLRIWEERGFVKDHYHRYPVISVSFKEVKEANWKDAVTHLKNVLSNLVMRYLDLEMNTFVKRRMEKLASLEAEDVLYTDALRLITQVLYENFKNKVVVLIDEYDVPIESAYTYRKVDPDYYDNAVIFMRNLLTAVLKDNEYLEFGILTGVYRVAKESIFSGLNNLNSFTVFDGRMADRFGFTETEVERMMKYYGLGREDRDTLDRWYGGYRVGNVENLYNPWSVIRYIDLRLSGEQPENSAQPFWINTSSNDLVKEQIEKNSDLKEALDSLLKGEEVVKRIDPWLSLRELEEKSHGVWTLLASSGYLSVRRTETPNRYGLRIPNEEIMYFFKDSVMTWLERETRVSSSKMVEAFYRMMENGGYDEFKNTLKEYLENALSYFDVGAKEPERVYKAFLLGILSMALNGFEVESELESGFGRLDVAVYPKARGKYALVFEIKKAGHGEDLEKKAGEALNQIKTREYYKKLISKGFDVIGFGMAFRKKDVSMAVEVFKRG